MQDALPVGRQAFLQFPGKIIQGSSVDLTPLQTLETPVFPLLLFNFLYFHFQLRTKLLRFFIAWQRYFFSSLKPSVIQIENLAVPRMTNNTTKNPERAITIPPVNDCQVGGYLYIGGEFLYVFFGLRGKTSVYPGVNTVLNVSLVIMRP